MVIGKESRDQNYEQPDKLGPTFYEPDYLQVKPTILQKSFGYKIEPQNHNHNPGPGSYLFPKEQVLFHIISIRFI